MRQRQTARRRHVAADAGGRAARRLRAGPKAGSGAAACLEAGSCGEGFACIFWVCAVLLHQACADGSVFFCRQLSRAGLSESTHHPWLVPDPDSQPWQVSGRAGTRTGMTGRDPETTSQKAGLYVNLCKKKLFRAILIARDTIIARVQGSAGRHVWPDPCLESEMLARCHVCRVGQRCPVSVTLP